MKIIFINEIITHYKMTLIATKYYKNHPILIINNKCLLPEGWLEMFIIDHLKYPKDAIAASIQYYFGKNGKITELSEGFKIEKLGIFNHVTELVFNFGIFNADFGGILFPENFYEII